MVDGEWLQGSVYLCENSIWQEQQTYGEQVMVAANFHEHILSDGRRLHSFRRRCGNLEIDLPFTKNRMQRRQRHSSRLFLCS